MASQIQYRRGTNAQNADFTGALAEITVDTTNGTLRVHDGITAGGSNIATVSYVTAQIGALSANSISSGTSNVRVVSSGGNVTTSVGGVANVVVVATTGAFVTGLISVTGNVQGGNLRTAGLISATGSITGASVVGGVITGTSASVTGAVTGASLVGTLTTAAQPNITSVGTLSTATITTLSTSAITKTGSNGVGNIGQSDNSFNTIFAKATSAQYADLAEKYTADVNYPPGTVVEFGGTNEVTITTASHSTQVAGIVSTNPSYLMNSGLVDQNAIEVALVGRVPCRVVGTIVKGDRLVASAIPGVATRLDMTQYQPGCIVGKALEAYDSSTVGTIEVAVGRI
jgi:hypothetical protein